MGKIEKQVQEHEKEKHLDTEELIGVLLWYIRESNNIAKEFTRALGDLNEAFNSTMAEYKAKEETKCQTVKIAK